ncbi:MAG: hypothetical protein JW947_08530, partial [Sedimentisphaerales bacterium]|nr:hypothetical protein [Sedimentisphaerales bacterium]
MSFYHIPTMKRRVIISIICVNGYYIFAAAPVTADDGYGLWQKYKKSENTQRLKAYQKSLSSVVTPGESATSKVTRDELKKGLNGLLGRRITFEKSVTNSGTLVVGTTANCEIIRKLNYPELGNLGKEGYIIKTAEIDGKKAIVITSNEDIGLLYGTFHFLRLIQTGQDIDNLKIVSKPKIRYRLLNHWDNINGGIERGYGGRSIWKWDKMPKPEDEGRYVDYARANASIGINGAVLNNVNANAKILTKGYLERIAEIADVLRPYGIRVYLSANFSSPVSSSFRLHGNTYRGIGDLNTADPLDPRVKAWWKDKVKEIYELIPDFGGFLVKANSEGMPGPQDFGRTHADGANMLSEALAPYNGIVMWRAFVYDPDVDPDRTKRSYMEFVPLDGQFNSNVFVQSKNGPLDFQPREPVHALFGAMPSTPLLLELQITQEYLGHSTHLVYLAPMWKEYLDFDLYSKGKDSTLASIVDGTLDGHEMTGIAGVANTGTDRSWCGHIFAQANWYAYGRLAWDHELSAEEIADE